MIIAQVLARKYSAAKFLDECAAVAGRDTCRRSGGEPSTLVLSVARNQAAPHLATLRPWWGVYVPEISASEEGNKNDLS